MWILHTGGLMENNGHVFHIYDINICTRWRKTVKDLYKKTIQS
jgi:hypothetical protein